MVRRVLALETGSGDRFLMWKSDDGQVAFAREVLRPVVERIFDVDEFGRLFDPDEAANVALDRRADPPELAGWTTETYRQEAAIEAYRQMVDPTETKVSNEMSDDAEGLDFYRLVGDRRRFALEARVFDGGKTDVYLIAYLPTSAVEEMWEA